MTTNVKHGSSYALFAILLLILIVGVVNLFLPRSPTISTEAIAGVERSTEQLQRVADSFEKNTSAMTELNRSLLIQARTRKTVNDEGYNELLKKWGIDVDDGSGYVNPASLHPQVDNNGSGHVPASKSGTNPTGKHSETTGSGKTPANTNNAGTAELRKGVSSEPVK